MTGTTHKRTLIVEDESDISSFLEMVLQEEGYQVSSARNGREALRIVHERAPDVILLDLEMPVLNGWEFLREIQADALSCTIPIIVVSAAYSSLHDPRLDDIEVIEKPVDVNVLLRKMEEATQHVSGERACNSTTAIRG